MSAITEPLSSTSWNGSAASARVHVPRISAPPVNTSADPVPIVCASGLRESAGLGR
ncbi:MAG: hypothetical protein R2713_14305 [Ilumatobacteraceae bacterium]